MSKPIITLSSDGFISEPHNKMVKILSYFLSSLASESDTFKGSITSLSDIIAKSSSDYSVLDNNINTALQKLYSNYFDNVEVNCETIDRNGYLFIKINVTALQNNLTYKLDRSIKVTKSGDLIDYENELDKFYRLYVGMK